MKHIFPSAHQWDAAPPEVQSGGMATDGELLSRFTSDPVEAFWPLWQRHEGRLRQLCLREMNGQFAEAEDALSLVMLKALDRLPDSAGKILNVEAWLHRLARNLCIDLRREKLRRTEAAEDWKDFTLMNSPAAGPALANDETSEFRQRIASLPPSLREAFEWNILQELPTREVASRLGLSVASVRKRVQLARARLREIPAEAPHVGRPKVPTCPPPSKSAAPASPETRINSEPAVFLFTVRVEMPCGVRHLFHGFTAKKIPAPQRRIEKLRKSLQLKPGNWKTRLQLAECYYLTGEWQRAVEEWQLALPQRGQLPAALTCGETLVKLGDPSAALAVFHQIRQQEFLSTAAVQHLEGWLGYCEKDQARSVGGFLAAVELEPENPAHWRGLARAYALAQKNPEALDALQQALRRHPGDAATLSLGQEIMFAAGEMETALDLAQQLLQSAPLDLLTLKRVVECHCRLGFKKKSGAATAKKLLRQAARLAQNPLLLRDPLTAYFIAHKKSDRALALRREFFEQHPQCPRGRQNYLQLLDSSAQTSVPRLPSQKQCNGACYWHPQAGLIHA